MQSVGIVLVTVGSLRLADNPALVSAVERGPVVPLFVWAPEEQGEWTPGAASRWWLDRSLRALDDDLRAVGSRLIVRRGRSTADAVDRVAAETEATWVGWQRGFTPDERTRDERLLERLAANAIRAAPGNAHVLVDPHQAADALGHPTRVFSRYWRVVRPAVDVQTPVPAPKHVPAPPTWPDSDPIDALGLLPTIPWDAGLRATWTPGERAARASLVAFLKRLESYSDTRDTPSVEGTSRLSPHLHFGEISPRQIWAAVAQTEHGHPTSATSASRLRREIGWRDFAHYILVEHPRTVDHALDDNFDRLPWRNDRKELRAWQRGQTGYPLIDAGMRQLWEIGWMHNRVRMAVASFLVKDLLLPWQEGARWFWDTLVDADLANNTLGWQWSAGSGADAAPFPRIFNPTLQAERFDPQGTYIRRWIPELRRLPAPFILHPWNAPASVLAEAGVELGRTYPFPIVDHAAARVRALSALPTRPAPVKPRRARTASMFTTTPASPARCGRE